MLWACYLFLLIVAAFLVKATECLNVYKNAEAAFTKGLSTHFRPTEVNTDMWLARQPSARNNRSLIFVHRRASQVYARIIQRAQTDMALKEEG